MTTPGTRAKTLNLSSLNENVKAAQYAVRGELVILADHLQKTIKEGHSDLPFDKLLWCNIGNPQQLGQKPITFVRQLLALVNYPALLKSPDASKNFSKAALDRAQKIITQVPGGVGAYSHSQGLELVRQSVAKFIEHRDNFPATPDTIFLTDGASPGIQSVLRCIIRDTSTGILIPIPQYPLYTASIALLNGRPVPYYLNEEQDWSLEVSELDRTLRDAKSKGCHPKAIVIINPGNPTGQVLTKKNIEEILQFSYKEGLVVLADEVYQENCYDKEKLPFHSFKKVLRSMDKSISENLELFSFHSVSKGVMGECGHRGGYMEATNIDPQVLSEIYKLASISLCPNLDGQITVEAMVNPPQQGDDIFDLYTKEVTDIYQSLSRRADLVASRLNKLPGVHCNRATGAMYAFPTITIPKKAVEEAQKLQKSPDTFYCISLLNATGIVVVPGSGFGQKNGTFHFRTTFLPSEEQIQSVMDRLEAFHKAFLEKYKD